MSDKGMGLRQELGVLGAHVVGRCTPHTLAALEVFVHLRVEDAVVLEHLVVVLPALGGGLQVHGV